MTAVGNIVSFKGEAWAIADVGTPDQGRHRDLRLVRLDGIPVGCIAGDGDVEFIASPMFTPGMALSFNGRQVEVISHDLEGGLVRVKTTNRLPVGQHPITGRECFFSWDGEAEIAVGHLVAENISKLLEQADD